MPQAVTKILDELEIEYKLIFHEAAYTIKQAEKHWTGMEGAHCKNLFLRDNKGRQHYLLIADKHTEINLKELGKKEGISRLSFASEKRLDKYLKLKPGSVTPFGIINDTEQHVIVFVDQKLEAFEQVNFHPNINTATVTLSFSDFKKFLEWSGNAFKFVCFN